MGKWGCNIWLMGKLSCNILRLSVQGAMPLDDRIGIGLNASNWKSESKKGVEKQCCYKCN